MGCNCNQPQLKKCDRNFPSAVVEITNPENLVLFRKVTIPSSLGDETEFPASVGKYKNVLLVYEINGHIYLYSSDGIPTQLSTDVAELSEQVAELARKLEEEIGDREAADAAISLLLAELVDEMPDSFSAEEWNSFWQ